MTTSFANHVQTSLGRAYANVTHICSIVHSHITHKHKIDRKHGTIFWFLALSLRRLTGAFFALRRRIQ